MRFQDKIVMITGASSGIGRATALAFAAEGAQLMLADVDDDGGAETVRLVKEQGGTADYMTCDVRRADDVKALHDAVIERSGRLDIAVNNAGVGGRWAKLQELSEDEFDFITGVNLKGVWLCMREQIPLMQDAGQGVIVNMASVAGLIGAPRGSVYSASKHGVVGLTRSAAIEVAKRGIRVNAVCPSYTDTPMVSQITDVVPAMRDITQQVSPMKRLGTVEEVATAVLWLASPEATFVNGVVLPVDGGLTAM